MTTAPTTLEAPPWFTKSFDPSPTSQTVFVGGQTPRVLLKMRMAGYQYHPKITAPLEQFVLADLSGTIVSPGALTVNKDDKRGAFTDRVDVRVWFENEPLLTVRQAGPETSTEGGSSTQSMSFSLSGGFFGDTATANVGWSISSGVTQQLPDFEIQKDVGEEAGMALRHSYRLRLIEGAVYRDPIDAVETTGSGRIRNLPPKSMHDLDIFSSVLFHTPFAISGTRRLHVQVAQRLITIEKTYMLPSPIAGSPAVPYNRDRADQAQSSVIGCTLGWLKVSTVPTVATYDWVFDVDLANGDVALSQ